MSILKSHFLILFQTSNFVFLKVSVQLANPAGGLSNKPPNSTVLHISCWCLPHLNHLEVRGDLNRLMSQIPRHMMGKGEGSIPNVSSANLRFCSDTKHYSYFDYSFVRKEACVHTCIHIVPCTFSFRWKDKNKISVRQWCK